MNDLALRLDCTGEEGFRLQLDCRLPDTGITAIYGPSGSGKSTLLDCIAGLRRPAAGGLVRFRGESWLAQETFVPPWQRRVAYVFQDARLFPHLNVQQNLDYAASRRAGNGGASLEQVIRWLERPPAQPLFCALGLYRPHLPWYVPQRYFDEVSVGAAAQIRFDAVPGKVYNAAVSRKPPLVRSAGRSFEVWLDIDNPAQQLVPGLSLQASLTLDAARSGQLGVPRDAVVRNQGGTVWLWVVEGDGADGSVRRVEVEVAGASSDGLIIRAEGLAPGMRVVTRGNESLREGQAVSVVGER